MKRLNCYIYTRVSTSMQVDGYSLDAQKEKLYKYAEYQEMHVCGEYSDDRSRNVPTLCFDSASETARC